MTLVDPEELVGFTFEMPDEDGDPAEMTTAEATKDHQKQVFDSSQHKKFKFSCNMDQFKEILSHNNIMDQTKKQGHLALRIENEHGRASDVLAHHAFFVAYPKGVDGLEVGI